MRKIYRIAVACFSFLPCLVQGLVFEDNFEDSELDEAMWYAPYSEHGESFEVADGRLNFVAKTKPPENYSSWASVGSRMIGFASKDFDLTTIVQITGGTGDRTIHMDLNAGVFTATVYFNPPSGSAGSIGTTSASMWSSTGPWLYGKSIDFRGKRAELRLLYTSQNRLLRAYYRDADQSGASWQQLASFGLDGDRDGADGNLNWNLKSDTPFQVYLSATANFPEFSPVARGEMAIESVKVTQPVSVDTSKVIYSSLGDMDEFDSSNWVNVGWVSDYKRGLAWPFTVDGSLDRTLDSISLPITRDMGKNLELSVWVDQGSSNTTPKWTKVETLALNPTIKFWYEKYPDVLTFQSKLHPLLMRGMTYWLRAEPSVKSLTSSSSNCMYSWYCSKTGATPKLAYLPVESGMKNLPEWTFSSESYLAAFRVEGGSLQEKFSLANETPYWDFRTPPGPAVKLSWEAVSGTKSYEIWRDGVLIHPKSGTFTGRAFTNEVGLTPGGTHTFQIVAIAASGKSVSNTVTVAMPPDPGASATKPGGLALRADNPEWIDGAPSVVLRWTDAAGGNNYEIFRDGKSLGKVGDQNEYTDNIGLMPGATVKYQIKSKNSAGITSSNTVPVVLAKAPPTAVGVFTFSNKAPTLTGSTPKKPSVILNWTKASGAETYDVFRNGVCIAKDLKGFTFTDSSGLTQGLTYSYCILAKGSGGEIYSTDRSILMPAETITSLGDFKLSYSAPYWDDRGVPGPAVALSWTSCKGASGYSVYRDGVKIASGISGTKFINEIGLSWGGVHTFFVRAEAGTVTTDSNTVSIPMPSGPSVSTKTTILASDTPVLAMNLNGSKSALFSITVPENISALEIRSWGGSGDMALYLNEKAAPNPEKNLYSGRSDNLGNAEEIIVQNPKARTTYYLLMLGTPSFSGVNLVAKLLPGSNRVQTPSISPVSGSVLVGAHPINITCATLGAEIFYEIGDNPSDPKITSSKFDPERPPQAVGFVKVKAIAMKDGMMNSLPATAAYSPGSYSAPPIAMAPFATFHLVQSSNGDQLFYLDVPKDTISSRNIAGPAALGVRLMGGLGATASKGDAEVYIAKDRVPEKSDYKISGKSVDNGEIIVPGTQGLGGRWYFRVVPKNSGYNNLNLMAYYMPVWISALGQSIEPDKETWMICHGRASQKEDMRAVAEAVQAKRPGSQVLLIDWMAAASPNDIKYIDDAWIGSEWVTSKLTGMDLSGTKFIVSVAEKLQSLTSQVGMKGRYLNWIGHSWGSLLGYEFSLRQDYQTFGAVKTGGHIRRIIALDPAAGGQLIKFVTNDVYPSHSTLKFRNVAIRSFGFSSPNPPPVYFGDASKAATAEDSILIRFKNLPSYNPISFDRELVQHSGVVSAYGSLLDSSSPISAYFTIERMDLGYLSDWTQDCYNWLYFKKSILTALSAGFDHEALLDVTLVPGSSSKIESIDSLTFVNPLGVDATIDN